VAGYVPIVIDPRATFTMVFVWRNRVTHVPVDISAYNAHMQVRASPSDDTVLLEADSMSIGGIVIDGLAGRVSIVIPQSQTSTVTWKRAVYDLFLIPRTGVDPRIKILRGPVGVEPSVTR